MKRIIIFIIVYFFIFATGFAGLVYEVTWQKYLSRLFGSDIIATAIILATFLGGLSLGYFLCGKASIRIKNHFRVYAVLEGIIFLWCLFFPEIFKGVDSLTRYWRFSPVWVMLVQGFICAAMLIAIPTICMGGTIPILTRAISKNIIEATGIHAKIYSINTFGAFLGTLSAGFYLIPKFGLPDTMIRASMLNFGALITFYLLYLFKPRLLNEKFKDEISEAVPTLSFSLRYPKYTLYGIAFLSGFYVMTLENVLIRIANLSIGSSSYTFSIIVAVFILSIAIGSLLVGIIKKLPKYLLFWNQFLIALLLLILFLSLDKWPYYAHLIRIIFQANIVGFWFFYGTIFAVLTTALIIPVALMGTTIPIAFHELKQDIKNIGKNSGALFSFNTLGNLTGSLVGGIILFYFLNIKDIFLLAGLFAGFSAILGIWPFSKRYGIGISVLFLTIFIFAWRFFPYNINNFAIGTFQNKTPFPYSLNGPKAFFKEFNKNRSLIFYKDDPTCSVSVVEGKKIESFGKKPLSIIVNGKSDSSTIGDIYTLKLSAHLPSLLARDRKKVMVIGLGTGVTAGELSLYPDIERIDVAEISPAVVKALPYFQEANHYIHNDPRFRVHLGDAFRVLGRSTEKWDIIISEPSNPWVSGVDLLFTKEFYKMVKEHLTENGIFLQWVQLYSTNPRMAGMMVNTVKDGFRECHVFIANPLDMLIVARDECFTPEDIKRAEETFKRTESVKASLSEININSIDCILIRQIWTSSYISDYFSDLGVQTMDQPYLHYLAGKLNFMGAIVPNAFILNNSTSSYFQEYLLGIKYRNWEDIVFTKDMFAILYNSLKDKVSENILPMADSLKLKAYLGNPSEFPLSEEEKKRFKIEIIPFVMGKSVNEKDWDSLGMEKSSFRGKAEVLVDSVYTFRNWIIPYPVDGLKAILQEGIKNGRDDYEKNWCTVQLVLLFISEKVDKEIITNFVNQLIKDRGGRIILKEEDTALLQMLENQLKRYD